MHVLLRRAAVHLALGLLPLVFLTHAWAADPAAEYHAIKARSLKGIAEVDVVVLPPKADPGCPPPAAEQIETEVETHLQQDGVPVGEDAVAYLFVSVASVAALPNLLCGFAVSLELQQVVSLVRDTTITTFGMTWHKNGLGVVTKGKYPPYVQGMLTALVDEFISAYLAQNPPR